MMKNLDFLCMQAAQAMMAGAGEKSAKENLATKALGVLLENGPYGMILYLEVQKKDHADARANIGINCLPWQAKRLSIQCHQTSPNSGK